MPDIGYVAQMDNDDLTLTSTRDAVGEWPPICRRELDDALRVMAGAMSRRHAGTVWHFVDRVTGDAVRVSTCGLREAPGRR